HRRAHRGTDRRSRPGRSRSVLHRRENLFPRRVTMIALPVGLRLIGGLFALCALIAADAAPDRPVVSGDPARLARIRAAMMPAITRPISFDTPEADVILSALEVFPPDNPWNLVVEDWPLHPNSAKIVATVGANKPIRYNPDMGFILVPPNQKKIPLKV